MLYLVATPIGNLDDIAIRAIHVLRDVDVVASEDTRKTGRLLKHFGIQARQISFHEHNEHQVKSRIIQRLQDGDSVAVVTNAGTPGIADPGFTLVREANETGIEVSMVPGPSACVMALVLSGLPVHSFTFRGFPPRKPGPRKRFLEVDEPSPHTLIYYESPYRLASFLTDAVAVLGNRKAAVANDLTKMHEAVWHGSLVDLRDRAEQTDQRGEFVVVVAGKN